MPADRSKVGQLVSYSIQKPQQTVERFLELGATAAPQIPAQVVEPIIELEDRTGGRKSIRWDWSDALICVANLHGHVKIVEDESGRNRQKSLEPQQGFGAVGHERSRLIDVVPHAPDKTRQSLAEGSGSLEGCCEHLNFTAFFTGPRQYLEISGLTFPRPTRISAVKGQRQCRRRVARPLRQIWLMCNSRFVIHAAARLEHGLSDAEVSEAEIHTEQLVQRGRRLTIAMDASQSRRLISQLLAGSGQPTLQWRHRPRLPAIARARDETWALQQRHGVEVRRGGASAATHTRHCRNGNPRRASAGRRRHCLRHRQARGAASEPQLSVARKGRERDTGRCVSPLDVAVGDGAEPGTRPFREAGDRRARALPGRGQLRVGISWRTRLERTDRGRPRARPRIT